MIAALSLLGSALAAGASAAVPQISTAPASRSGGTNFGQALAEASARAVNDLRNGEATAISGLQGKAPVQQVVEAVMSARQSLDVAVAIRDKAVSAYQTLSQMAI